MTTSRDLTPRLRETSQSMSSRAYNRTRFQDNWVLMHWPRACFVFCFLIIGAFLSKQVQWDRLGLSFLGMFFVLQLAAYRLDELKGRHCSTNLSDKELHTTVAIGLAGGFICGAISMYWEFWMWCFLFLGFSGVILYNYEIAGFHNMWFFGYTWGLAPLWASYYFHAGFPSGWLWLPPPQLVAWGAFAIIFARLHIWSYGNTKCYHSGTCKDFIGKTLNYNMCHGQSCMTRAGSDVTKLVSKLQWQLINLQFYLVIVVTAAVVLGYYF